jgi:segregation and condensation protein A
VDRRISDFKEQIRLMQDFKIKTDKFEGPLDLLLELIEKRKLHISEISLAQIADDYLAYISSHQSFPIESSSQFLVVSATLLLIKSKALLPYLELTREEEKDVEELELRLKIYKEIKRIGEEIKEKYGKEVIYPIAPMPKQIHFSPGEGISKEIIKEHISSVIKNLPQKNLSPETKVRQVVSLEEMIERLKERIEGALQMTFHEFVGKDKTNTPSGEEDRARRVEVVIGFLAMLELVKQGVIQADQNNRFGNINLHQQEVGLPKYE